ncbi:hypothetical protein ACFLRA_00655 [Bdellovibrionota bacterium]
MKSFGKLSSVIFLILFTSSVVFAGPCEKLNSDSITDLSDLIIEFTNKRFTGFWLDLTGDEGFECDDFGEFGDKVILSKNVKFVTYDEDSIYSEKVLITRKFNDLNEPKEPNLILTFKSSAKKEPGELLYSLSITWHERDKNDPNFGTDLLYFKPIVISWKTKGGYSSYSNTKLEVSYSKSLAIMNYKKIKLETPILIDNDNPTSEIEEFAQNYAAGRADGNSGLGSPGNEYGCKFYETDDVPFYGNVIVARCDVFYEFLFHGGFMITEYETLTYRAGFQASANAYELLEGKLY